MLTDRNWPGRSPHVGIARIEHGHRRGPHRDSRDGEQPVGRGHCADPACEREQRRVYQDYGLIELIWLRGIDLRRLDHMEFRTETPEMRDVFDSNEKEIGVISNPVYTPKTSFHEAGRTLL